MEVLSRTIGICVVAGLAVLPLLCVPAYAQTAISGTAAGATTALAGAPSGALPRVPPAAAGIFPLTQVHRGLTGVAYTVFEGVDPEPMGVEILGVLKDAIGPGQDMILGRLTGQKAEYTGVVAGMSGSPVYVDGRLVGALSYRIGNFSKEPICGITPIEQMLEVRDGQKGSSGMRVAGSRAGASQEADRSSGSSGDRKPVSAGGEVTPIETALVFGGFSREAVERFGDRFKELGMSPVAGLGGAAPAGTHQKEPLVPGSAVSAVMVRGDLSIAGTCTVTYVDPQQLLACGHPITQFGTVSMPMTKAEVVATLASPLNAFKIINTTDTVGQFTEDRASAILGRFGETARMIPVSVQVLPAAASRPDELASEAMPRVVRVSEEKQVAPPFSSLQKGSPVPLGIRPAGGMHFEVLDNRELTPQAMLVSVYQSLSGTNASASQMSYRMRGELTVAGQPPVRMEGIMAPTEIGSGAVSAALYVNDRFGHLYSNAMEQPEVTGLHLTMEELPGRRSAVLESARVGATEVRPGQELEVEATVHPYQTAPQVVRLTIKLPETLPPGQMRIVVSDATLLDKLTGAGTGSIPGAIVVGGPGAHPVGLSDAVAQMNRAHRNDAVYVTLLQHEAQAALEAGALPGVPLSMANVLEPLRTSQKVQLTGESAVEVGSAEVGYALSGFQVLTVDVR
jgi:hypothetical protein